MLGGADISPWKGTLGLPWQDRFPTCPRGHRAAPQAPRGPGKLQAPPPCPSEHGATGRWGRAEGSRGWARAWELPFLRRRFLLTPAVPWGHFSMSSTGQDTKPTGLLQGPRHHSLPGGGGVEGELSLSGLHRGKGRCSNSFVLKII